MNEKIKVTEGNSFILAIPLIAINAAGEESPIQVDELTELACRMYSPCGSEYEVSVSSTENRIILQVPATMPNGVYNVVITARRDEQRISLRLKDCFEIVAWDKQSNWQDYIIGDHIELTDQPFIAGYYNTDAELEALKEELRQQKEAAAQAQAEAEAAKAEYDRKAEMLDDVAKETTLLQKSAAIIEAISGIHIDIPENIATKDDVTAAKQAILDALSHIDIDTSDLAKEATLGASPDTSVSQTIFGWLKSIRDFLVGIVTTNPYAKETTAQQAASDAAAAKVAAQAITGYALQGSDATATNTAILNAIHNIVVTAELTPQQISDLAQAAVAAIESGVTLDQLRTAIINAGNAATTAATNAQSAATNAQSAATQSSNAAQAAANAAASAADAAAAAQALEGETTVYRFPTSAMIDIETPEESTGDIVDLHIVSNILYTLGDITSMSLVMEQPEHANIYNEFCVRFYADDDFTLRVKHYNAAKNTLASGYWYEDTCYAGHMYLLSIEGDLPLLGRF